MNASSAMVVVSFRDAQARRWPAFFIIRLLGRGNKRRPFLLQLISKVVARATANPPLMNVRFSCSHSFLSSLIVRLTTTVTRVRTPCGVISIHAALGFGRL